MFGVHTPVGEIIGERLRLRGHTEGLVSDSGGTLRIEDAVVPDRIQTGDLARLVVRPPMDCNLPSVTLDDARRAVYMETAYPCQPVVLSGPDSSARRRRQAGCRRGSRQ